MADEHESSPSGDKPDTPLSLHVKALVARYTLIGSVIGSSVGVFRKGLFDVLVQKEKGTCELQAEMQKSTAARQIEEQKASAEQQLERQRFDAELVKTALASPDQEKRLEFLEFMVETHLILDKDIRDGVESYVKRVKQNPSINVPQFLGTISLSPAERKAIDMIQQALISPSA